VVVITGSNGKSSVTSLVGEMAAADNLNVAVGGNIGVPALDLLQLSDIDLYVLELSSFQLEMTFSLRCVAAVVLNISDDHLDRHNSMQSYAAIKQKVYQNCGAGVINQDDSVVSAMVHDNNHVIRYGLKHHSNLDIKLGHHDEKEAIIFFGEHLIDCDQIKMPGRHNISNAMAAAALASTAGISKEAIVTTLKTYSGLSHRCQWVAQSNGVNWYDDSKGTNVGATIAAIEGLPQKQLILIAGGQGKGADFTALAKTIIARARAVVLIGEDADKIEAAIASRVDVYRSTSMVDAVNQAKDLAQSGDAVLLSPACASFDMFKGYADRGMQFQKAVHEVIA
jgi:UDP-N-acetylmuramoylalanine--D-glutamate ligase